MHISKLSRCLENCIELDTTESGVLTHSFIQPRDHTLGLSLKSLLDSFIGSKKETSSEQAAVLYDELVQSLLGSQHQTGGSSAVVLLDTSLAAAFSTSLRTSSPIDCAHTLRPILEASLGGLHLIIRLVDSRGQGRSAPSSSTEGKYPLFPPSERFFYWPSCIASSASFSERRTYLVHDLHLPSGNVYPTSTPLFVTSRSTLNSAWAVKILQKGAARHFILSSLRRLSPAFPTHRSDTNHIT
jgi:hypothetical protein